jgi:K+-transporting ATPase KdpF subunit
MVIAHCRFAFRTDSDSQTLKFFDCVHLIMGGARLLTIFLHFLYELFMRGLSLPYAFVAMLGTGKKGGSCARHYLRCLDFGFLRRCAEVRALLRKGMRGEIMNIEYIISAIISLGLLIYLLYALLKPEKF